ncbi:MAG: family 43 glycosylhydrolase [Bacteroidales bacterium]|nr:family 43 glycosylhydrolase [Bacteroidales bacterium]
MNYARPDFVNISTKDNGDATFANPILSADFPDPILVQSGNTYYLVSTNQNRFPSTTILESKDLVNWQYSSQPIDSIPLESKILVDETNIQAGTMVTVGKEQWAIVSYDNGLLGKFPYLLPVTMVDGKPVVDVTAKVSLKIKKPKVGRGYIATYLPTNDAFRHYKLGSQWAWNKKPDNTKWSLVERAGYMRLKTGAVADSLHHAQNIMTQRVLSYKNDTVLSYGTIRMEIKGMKDGDVAGLSVSKNKYGYIGVAMNNGEKKLVTCVNNEMQTGPVVSDTVIYLRGVVNDTTKIAEFYYSFNETTFTKLGGNLTMDQELPQAGGCLFGLFNYATASEGGYVDVDWFSTEPSYDESFYYAENNTVNYTIQSLTLTDIKVTGGDSLTYLANSSSNLIVKATYADGHTEDISSACRYESLNPDVVDINRGAIVTRKDGEATVNISFTGPLGEQKVVTVHISSEIFPLVKKLFNPSIYATGNFYDKIKTLRTGQWGFGGWVYKNGIDLSGYKYLVFKFYSVAYCGASLRIFDENNYWSGAAQYDFGSNKQVVVNLESMVKSGTTTKVDPSHLYMIGLWSDGSSNIVISDVYVTNNDDYSKMNGIEDVQDNLLDENEPVDVYSVMGVKIRSNVLRKDATLNLPEGMYIVGNQKVMVLKQ